MSHFACLDVILDGRSTFSAGHVADLSLLYLLAGKTCFCLCCPPCSPAGCYWLDSQLAGCHPQVLQDPPQKTNKTKRDPSRIHRK